MAITLDTHELAELLGTHGEGILATTTQTGRAIPLPVWYVVLDDTICIRTPARSKRVANIRRDPRVSFLVHGGTAWRELRGALVSDRAEIVEDVEEARRIIEVFQERFAGLLPPPLPHQVAAAYADTVVLRLRVGEQPLSWDNRKIRLPGA